MFRQLAKLAVRNQSAYMRPVAVARIHQQQKVSMSTNPKNDDKKSGPNPFIGVLACMGMLGFGAYLA